jgi:protein Hikeshi
MDIDGDPNAFQLPVVVGTANQLAVAAAPFGLIVPGCPVRTDFSPVDATKFAMTLTCPGDIGVPLQSVREVVVFSTTTPIPPDLGVLCYWQLTAVSSNPTSLNASTGFELLGAITASQPSAVFQTGWSENEQLAELLSSQNSGMVTITIGLSLEPVSNIQNIGALNSKVEQGKLYVAQKIAADLFKFMQSFDTGTSGSNMMVVPNNVFDRWFRRFENRFRRDPNFFLKQQAD